MEQSPSLEANSSSASLEIQHILLNANFTTIFTIARSYPTPTSNLYNPSLPTTLFREDPLTKTVKNERIGLKHKTVTLSSSSSVF